MSAIPGDIETDAGPPMRVPLRHFVVGLGFLLAGAVAGTLSPSGALPGRATLAHVHLLLVGWVCVTIMGAMTQFVPVWSGTTLHSRRLSAVQLWAVTGGLAGFAGCLFGELYAWLPFFGGLVLVGFWTFVYNVGRTLLGVRPWDVTERHFALALGFFLVATLFGLVLAAGYASPALADLPGPITRRALLESHATLAVFGAVLTTVFGALYQLGTMFTQTTLRGVDRHLRLVEEAGYPLGVVALAGGRLFGAPAAARVGAPLVLLGVAAMGLVLGRRLVETAVEPNPMLRRYAVAAAAMLAWALASAPAWYADPLDPAATFGSPAAVHLLLFGVVGFVVAGTLYHVVPFIVWVHRYSDRLGIEPVPMIDDLYDDRLARIDLAALSVGAAALVLAESLPAIGALGSIEALGSIGAFERAADVAEPLAVLGGLLATLGFVAFAVNLGTTIRRHGRGSGASETSTNDSEASNADGFEAVGGSTERFEGGE